MAGLTLIELLVVIAVIAILAAMLLPTLNRARTQGEITYCKNNLHQWGIAMGAYLADFGVYPRWFMFGTLPAEGPPPAFEWFQLLQPYTSANWTNDDQSPEPPGIHVCPGYARLGGRYVAYAASGDECRGSYGYNVMGYAPTPALGLGWETEGIDGPPGP